MKNEIIRLVNKIDNPRILKIIYATLKAIIKKTGGAN